MTYLRLRALFQLLAAPVAATLVAACVSDAKPENPTGVATSALGAATTLRSFPEPLPSATPTAGGLFGSLWATVGSRVVFGGSDTLHGNELWTTDGTGAGTQLLRDFSGPQAKDGLSAVTAWSLVSLGTKAIVVAKTPSGNELWTTDGTVVGTTRLKSGVQQNVRLVRSGNAVYSAGPGQLLRTDGTVAGTTLVDSRSSGEMVDVGGTLYFHGQIAGCGIFCILKTDGTPAGTVQVSTSSISPALGATFGAVGNTLFLFDASKQIFSTTGAEPSLVATLPGSPYYPAALGTSLLFFVASSDLELWKTDGTTTALVATVAANATAALPGLTHISVSGGKAYFGVSPNELWVSDGTTAGTQRVATGAGASFFFGPSPYNGGVVFQGTSPASGTEPYFTDGTVAGTVPLADVVPGAVGSYPVSQSIYGAGPLVYFATPDGQLWKSTGIGNAVSLKKLDPGTPPAPSELVTLGTNVYFAANDGANGRQLWVTDGTSANTKRVTTGASHNAVRALAPFESKVYFSATTSAAGAELFASDGTEAGTSLVADVLPGSGLSTPYELTPSGSHLFFTAASTGLTRGALAFSTAGGVVSLLDATPGSASFVSFKNGALLNGGTFPSTAEYFSDGTVAGTVSLGSPPSSGPPCVVGTTAYYVTSDGLWKTDGTPANTSLVKALPTGGLESVAVGTTVYFSSNGLWKSDGTAAGTTLVVPGAPRGLTAFGTKLVYTSSSSADGDQWFITDGTSAGTVKLADGVGECVPRAIGSTFYFCATGPDGVDGEELWTTDGTPANTKEWFDLNPFAARSAPANFTLLGNKLLFTGYEITTPSLFSADPAIPDPPPRDAGTGADDGGDAGVPSSGGDAGTSSPAAAAGGQNDSGCGCRVVAAFGGRDNPSALGMVGAVAGLALVRRRRRK